MFDNLEKSMLMILGSFEPTTLEERVQMIVDKINAYDKDENLYDLENAEPYDKGIVLVRKKTLKDALGLTELGSGYFSRVFDAGPGLVVKITNDSNDHAYDAFAKFCMANDSKHLPKIFWRGAVGDRMVYLMERLVPYEGEMKIAVSSLLRMKLMQLGADRAQRNGKCDTSSLDSMLSPTVFGPELATTACSLVQEFDNLKSGEYDPFRWDLHGDNAMRREDGTPVFTDPWSA